MHFRGLPSSDFKSWTPICSTAELPVVGEVTKHAHEVDCRECLRIIHAPRRDHRQASIPWDQRPASRAFLDTKKRAAGDEQ